ncbi:HK97-gp10 family putative phage morphogenesis protein [Paraferrimonas haliotis]|uniref:HK97 gp10 family phage protein n=1 Tax=Paraferrimonas haliotis TaxID=2013866 RepID=A0AA37WW40_9GAMM|nr:HK97-gp10 family putative phage morphogenesis protein [Paraferrimonas haliotis]GLS83223.1 hypothetical protein GCM10007894_12000 [Paraferrimonas haliotis]
MAKDVIGIEELEKALLELEVEAGWKTLRTAINEGAKLIQNDMAANANFNESNVTEPHMADQISRAVRKPGSRSRRDTAAVAIIGPRKGHKQKAIAQEYGQKRGQIAIPFILPALERNAEQVVKNIDSSLKKALF